MKDTARAFEMAAMAVLCLLAACVGLRPIRSWDIWWHLKTGELALARWSTLPVDEFSLTQAGDPWPYKDLGADIILQLLYSGLGEWGIALFKLAVALGLMALLVTLARQQGCPRWLVPLLAGTAFSVAAFRIIARPMAFSLVLLPSLLCLLERRRTRGGAGPLVWIAVLVGVWANLHRAVVLGVVLIWGYALCELAVAIARRPRAGGFRGSLLCACVATVALFANPSGAALVTHAVSTAGGGEMADLVSEWERLSLAQLWARFPLAVVWLGLAAVLVPLAAGVSRRRRPDGVSSAAPGLWDIALVAGFCALALRAPRMLPLAAIGTVGPVAAAASALGVGWPRRVRGRLSPLPLLGASVAVLLAWKAARLEPPAPGWATDWYPEAAMDLILGAPVEGEGYTTYTFAGYVIHRAWPHKHVICDGRAETVYPIETLRACIEAPRSAERFQVLVDRYDLQWALTHNRGAGSGAEFLDRDPSWSLVHWDQPSLLYLRLDGPNASLARQLGFTMLRAHDPDVAVMEHLALTEGNAPARAHLREEVLRVFRAAPDDYRTIAILVLFLHGNGERDSPLFQEAVRTLELMRERDPQSVDRVLDWIE